jgi:hypothetical protein
MATEQTQKMITVTSKAAEKIHEFMKEEAESPQYQNLLNTLEYMFKVAAVLVCLTVWALKKHQKKMT